MHFHHDSTSNTYHQNDPVMWPPRPFIKGDLTMYIYGCPIPSCTYVSKKFILPTIYASTINRLRITSRGKSSSYPLHTHRSSIDYAFHLEGQVPFTTTAGSS